MEETKIITQQAIGYSFFYSVEQEIRTETNAKYPDKKIVKAGLDGHANSFEDAVSQLRDAQAETLKIIAEKQGEAEPECGV